MKASPGVCWHKGHNKWMSYIMLNKEQHYLGYFDTHDQAIEARKEAENKLGFQRSKPLPEEKACELCGKATKFRGHTRGYARFCSKICSGTYNASRRTQSANKKISQSMIDIWENRRSTGEDQIIKNNMSKSFNYNVKRGDGGWVKTQKGYFKPLHPEKYAGNPNNIIYRSSWELAVFQRFDLDPNIISWASEEICIPYFDRATGRARRYFPDIIVKSRNPDGTIKTVMIEIKPYCQTIPPVKGSKSEKRYLKEVSTFATNFSKFEQAREYCRKKGWQFVVLTERDLKIG